MLFLLLFAHLIVSLQSHCLDRLHLGSTKKKVFFLCTSLGLHYLWTCSPKILTFGKAEEKMLFSFAFRSLNRIFARKMVRYCIITLMVWLSLASGKAQTTDVRCLDFMGVPIEGAVDSFLVRIQEKNFTPWGDSGDGEDYYFRGNFYGIRAKLMVSADKDTKRVESMYFTVGPYRTKEMMNRNTAYFLRKLSQDYGNYTTRNGSYYFFNDYGNVKVSITKNNDGASDINIFFQPTTPFYKDAVLLGLKGNVQEVMTTNPVSENAMERFARDGKMENPDIMERIYNEYGYLTKAKMLERNGTSSISYEYDDRNRLVRRTLTNEKAAITYVNEYIYNEKNEILNESQKVYNEQKECLMSVNMRNEYTAHDDDGNWTRNQLNIVYWEKDAQSQSTNVVQTRKIRYWDE